jgi:hypothetical protein
MVAKLANRSHIRTPPTTLTAMAAKLPGRVEGAGAG